MSDVDEEQTTSASAANDQGPVVMDQPEPGMDIEDLLESDDTGEDSNITLNSIFSLLQKAIECQTQNRPMSSSAGGLSLSNKFARIANCSDSLPQKTQSGNPATVSGDTSGQPEKQQVNEGIGDSPDDLKTQYDDLLDDMYDEYEPTQKLGPPVNEELCKIFQDLIWGIHKEEKMKDVSENILAPSNIKGLQVNRVNPEIWREMSHETKTNDLKLQRLQALLLKSMMLTTNAAEQLFCAKSSGTSSVADIAKIAIKFCADSAMVLGQLNSDLLDSRREFILPELNSDFRKIVIEKGEHPELLFGDNLSQKIKDISETNKLGQAVAKRNFVPIKTGPQKSQPFLYRPQGRPRGRYHKSQTAPYSRQRRGRKQQQGVRRFSQNSSWQTDQRI